MVESQYLRTWRQEYQNVLCKGQCHTNLERVCRMESSVSLSDINYNDPHLMPLKATLESFT